MWEVLRDCDLYEATLTKNKEMIAKLYFGTPHENFRKRIQRLYGSEISFPKEYIWYPIGKPDVENCLLDIDLGIDMRSGAKVRPGQLIHKLLLILTSDFYRPFKLQTVFSLLFANEFYNAVTSPHKIHDLVGRLGDWFKKNKIPMKVTNPRGEYLLVFLKPYGIKTKPFLDFKNPLDAFIEQLKNKFNREWFISKDVVLLTGFSLAKVKRFLREAIALDKMNLAGQGKATKYSLKSSQFSDSQ